MSQLVLQIELPEDSYDANREWVERVEGLVCIVGFKLIIDGVWARLVHESNIGVRYRGPTPREAAQFIQDFYEEPFDEVITMSVEY